MPTVNELRRKGHELLYDHSDHSGRDVDLLLMHVLSFDRMDLLLKGNEEVESDKVIVFEAGIERLLKSEPLAYILGMQEFMGLEFKVKPGVLIPRQDTELLVETLIERFSGQKIKLLELGLGSGAIALSLGHFLKGSTVIGVDIDDVPIEVTNINSHGLNVPIEILQGDLFAPVGNEHKLTFDLIVSNPPYISQEEMMELSDNVDKYEPHLALCGGEKGYEFYERIVPEAVDFLKENGTLAFEIGYNQGRIVKDLMLKYGYRNVTVLKDLAGHDRVVLGNKG